MKEILGSTILCFVFSEPLLATTISSANLINALPSEYPIVDETGALIPMGAGAIGVGYFGSDTAISQANDAVSLLEGFTQFGATGSFRNGFNAPGFFQFSTDELILNGGNHFDGNNIYVLIANGPDFLSSEYFAIWKSGQTFFEENQYRASHPPADLREPGALLLGNFVGQTDVLGFPFDNGIQLVRVPEPSNFLLSTFFLVITLFVRCRKLKSSCL